MIMVKTNTFVAVMIAGYLVLCLQTRRENRQVQKRMLSGRGLGEGKQLRKPNSY
jgi:hypothetical protein